MSFETDLAGPTSMPKPELDLTSVYAKLERAKEHYRAVDAEISKWLENVRHEPFFERGQSGTRLGVAVLQVGPPPDLIRWSLIIGDCLNNLRSTLDHLINAFTKVTALYRPTGKKERITFVIIDDPDEFANARKTSLKGFDGRLLRVLESLQPFTRKHDGLPSLLGTLRDLSNKDKHHLLQVASAGVAKFDATFIADQSLGTKIAGINPDPIRHNDVVCIIQSSEPDPNLSVESVSVQIEIAIWHGLPENDQNPLHQRTGYSVLLPMLIQEVAFVVNSFKRII